jgi:hypothetical protein
MQGIASNTRSIREKERERERERKKEQASNQRCARIVTFVEKKTSQETEKRKE